ncbi:hypothetical protein [Marinirhabdus gelatinilytica]|uniref:Lipoprotein n=1 Tax=Marinirhabdus gelatinilytica TaxID=1703343 RepID=A0A370QK69_9FLAO|nr:hypothetical protein [Marinirhabdus gelatinilytica]RDK88757.1 hypothetical protein C8D94_101634 [Marinirhabdus gelatinilytica]
MTVIRGNKPKFSMQVATIVSVWLLIACGTPSQKKSKTVIGPPVEDSNTPVVNIPKDDLPVIEPKLPKGAVTANFLTDRKPFYAVVDKKTSRNGRTTIIFENSAAPNISIPETYGATLETLRFDEFDRDLLLVKTKLKDPVFTKYFLYVLRNGQWKPVVNGFSIHRDNSPESLKPIVVDPSNPNNMKRYYSVFDLDETSTKGYTWRLLTESVPIQNW